MSDEMSMFFDIVNIGVAVFVVANAYLVYQRTRGHIRQIVMLAGLSAMIIGLIELTGFLQVFPRDSFIQDLLYEADLVLCVLLLFIITLAGKYKK